MPRHFISIKRIDKVKGPIKCFTIAIIILIILLILLKEQK